MKAFARDFFQNLVTTSLGGYHLISFSVFLLVGFVWALVFAFEFPQLAGNAAFASALSPAEIVIGFVFFIFLRMQLYGYVDPVKEYAELAERIEKAGMRLMRAFDGVRDEAKRKDATRDVRNVKAALQSMAFVCYQIYSSKNRDVLDSNDTPGERKVQERLESSGEESEEEKIFETASLADVGKKLANKVKVWTIPGLPEDLRDLSRLDPLEACKEIEGFLYQEFGHLSEFDFYVLVERQMAAVSEKLVQIAVNARAKDTGMAEFYVGFVLFAYFGVWLPITLWIRLGALGGPVAYAIAMSILSAPAIWRRWQGSAMSPTRPIRGALHEDWPIETMERLEALYWEKVVKTGTSAPRTGKRGRRRAPPSSSEPSLRARGEMQEDEEEEDETFFGFYKA